MNEKITEKTSGPLKTVALGDSFVTPFRIAPYAGWVELIAKDCGVKTVNRGIAGDTTTGMLVRLQRDVFDEGPDFVIIAGGLNDFVMGADIAQTCSNMMAIVNQCIARGIMPVVGIPIPPLDSVCSDWVELTDFGKVADKMRAYRSAILKFCKVFKITYLDFYKATALAGKADLYLHDGIHLNREGHSLIAHLVCESTREWQKRGNKLP